MYNDQNPRLIRISPMRRNRMNLPSPIEIHSCKYMHCSTTRTQWYTPGYFGDKKTHNPIKTQKIMFGIRCFGSFEKVVINLDTVGRFKKFVFNLAILGNLERSIFNLGLVYVGIRFGNGVSSVRGSAIGQYKQTYTRDHKKGNGDGQCAV